MGVPTHAGLLSEYPGWAGKLDQLEFLEPWRIRAAAHSAPGRPPGGLFENRQCPVPREKYLNCEQFCTYGQRQIAFNQSSLDAPAVGPDPGLP
jgi:hypothetical protein